MSCSLRHAICSTLAFAAAGAACAQEVSEAPEVEEVIVTGRAGVEDIRKIEVSYAITTIDSEALHMDAPLGVADALGSVPAFWVESSGGEGSANIRARGIPTEGFSTVGMLEDGLPIQHDPGIGWLNADQSFRLDGTIERMEVVRGGPSSVFTSNAPGGVVNFVTRRPGTTPEGSVGVESSDYGLMRADAWYSMPAGDWRVGIGGFHREDDGIRDPTYTANKGGQLRFAVARDFERGSIDFNVKRIDDNVIFYTGLPLTYDASGDAVGVPGIDAHHGTLSGPETRCVTLLGANGTFPLDVGRGTDLELTQYTFKFQYELPGDWHVSNGTRYRESETSRIGLFPNSVVTGASRLDSVRAGILASTPGAVDVQLRYLNSPNTVFDLVNQNGNGLITDGSLRQVHVPLDELTNDLRLLKNFEVGGQSHDVAIGVYVAKVDESFDRYSANSLIDIRDNARLLDLTVSHVRDLTALQPYFDRLLLIPGMEITTFQGHANAFNLREPVDFRVGSAQVPDWNTLLTAVAKQGVLVSINHPNVPSGERCMGCGWTAKPAPDMSRVQAIEIVNGNDVESPTAGLPFWQQQLQKGLRHTAIGGSDTHDVTAQDFVPTTGRSGVPTTVVYASALSSDAIIAGIRSGNVFVDTAGTRDRLLEFSASSGGAKATMGGTLAVSIGQDVEFQVRIANVAGGRVAVVRDAVTDAAANAVIADDDHRLSFADTGDGARHWVRINVRDRDGRLVLIGNPIYLNW